MAIDVEKARGATIPGQSFSWTEKDVILYHLGIGAGNPPTDPGELRYAYEGDLHVLPTFATIPPFALMMSFGAVEGFEISLAQILHGEQETVVHAPIPVAGSVSQEGRVVDIYDKGKGALAILEFTSSDAKTGEPLFTNTASIFVKGEGGFGGDSGPPVAFDAPDRQPDHVVASPTMPQQALLYRMSSGDLNPLHADPGFAAFAGYERPILHGLCTYGIAAKAAIDSALGGQPEEVASYRARFSGVVFPGETVVTSVWDEGDHLVLSATTEERGEPVITNAAVFRR